MHYFNFDKEIKEKIINSNQELAIYDWELIKALYFTRYGNQFTVTENLALFKGQLINRLYIGLTTYLDVLKSNDYLRKNLEQILSIDGKNTSQTKNNSVTKTDSSNHSFTKTDPHNLDNDVYITGSKTDASAHSQNKNDGETVNTSTSVNNSNKLRFLKEIYDYFKDNNIYNLILDTLEPLYRQVLTDTMMLSKSGCGKPCKPNFCLGINYPSLDDVENLISNLDYIDDMQLKITEETDEDGAVRLEGGISYG